ncbi:protein mono-ADP-ribosyltransferase PARP4-like [Engraulis encrasicolus]|uniref:protein mono-ADP-ribosyltransferase PARP4-like n=1 Tax=Engraulis encrasicolus TaxID=184585 RepID=UPI002FCEC9C0
MLSVNEAVMRSSSPSSLGKYRALGCSIQTLRTHSPDYHTLTHMLQQHSDIEMQIQDVFRVQRGAELQMFREELGNVRPLLHSTSPASFVGILSRGLLLPRVGVERHGVERTDIGFLGGGIYFSDSFSTSVKYSKRSETDGSRLLLVCEVALGHCRDVRKRDTTLTAAPDGYHSMHGVRSTPNQHSEFEDDEYVVYSPDQVRLKYVVRYTLPGDELKAFQPQVDTAVESVPSGSQTNDTITKSDKSEKLEDMENPLDSMAAGLLDSAGQKLPLQAVHVKCKLVDLLSQVIIFQTYSNPSPVAIEAKYVFPLEETAAVCGFEAFINGKHVIGEVKEKEQARKEYKQAIAKGHGAYLMDQEAPDVFTISVGNLPPGATVLIKVTFLSELLVTDDAISFQLPGSVAPWQQSSALNERTQTTVEKVCVSEHSGDFSLSLSMEMPYEIESVFCSTHDTEIKKTQCKGVLRTLPGETMSSDGFHLFIYLREMHMPRMWVENHPDKDSQACMLVFFPDLEGLRGAGDEEPWPASGPASGPVPGGVEEVVILVDSSESMRGESLISARRIAAYMIKNLDYVDNEPKINVVLFGTDQQEAFAFSKDIDEGYREAKYWIRETPAVGGSTELWRPLRSLSLLPPSRGSRSVVLLSDGHVQNPALTLQLARSNAAHTRIFTCGLSKTANKHMLRALAQASGGAYEFFDTKTRHTWSKKVESLVGRMTSPGCSSVSVKWQLFNPRAPPPVQAPAQLHALFSKHHTLVYGFVPHCTQATLYGDLCGKELKTMVSTTELQKTKGTFLHKLTARAVIRDYEDGILHLDEAEHEGKKAEMKSFIVDLSKEFSILSQFTSFVAIEERDPEKPDKGFTDIPKLIAEADVDLLPYMAWKDPNEEWEKGRKRYSTTEADTEYYGFYCGDDDEDDDYEEVNEEDLMICRSTAMPDVEEDFSVEIPGCLEPLSLETRNMKLLLEEVRGYAHTHTHIKY